RTGWRHITIPETGIRISPRIVSLSRDRHQPKLVTGGKSVCTLVVNGVVLDTDSIELRVSEVRITRQLSFLSDLSIGNCRDDDGTNCGTVSLIIHTRG